MKENVKTSHDDALRLVRITTKCADCLVDFDIVDDLYQEGKSKYIRQELKKEFPIFGNYIEKFSSKFLKAFVEADQDSQKELQQSFREFSDKMWLVNEEMTALFMTYAKAKSILIDISEMEYSDPNISYLKKVCENYSTVVGKKYGSILKLRDEAGYGVEDIVKGLDKLSKSIMYK